MYCLKCGNEIPEGSQFCKACGAPVASVQTAGVATTNQKADQDFIFTLLAGIGFGVVGLIEAVTFTTGYGSAVGSLLALILIASIVLSGLREKAIAPIAVGIILSVLRYSIMLLNTLSRGQFVPAYGVDSVLIWCISLGYFLPVPAAIIAYRKPYSLHRLAIISMIGGLAGGCALVIWRLGGLLSPFLLYLASFLYAASLLLLCVIYSKAAYDRHKNQSIS